MDLDAIQDERAVKVMLDDLQAREPANKQEERSLRRMRDQHPPLDPETSEAVDLVLRASGEHLDWFTELRIMPAAARRLWARARLDGSPSGETNWHLDGAGRMVLSGDTALRLAQALATAEPAPVRDFLAQQRLLDPDAPNHDDFEPDADQAVAIVMRWATPRMLEVAEPSHAMGLGPVEP